MFSESHHTGILFRDVDGMKNEQQASVPDAGWIVVYNQEQLCTSCEKSYLKL